MANVADIGSKRLVGLAPDQWVQWVTQQPDLVTQAVVNAGFQWVSRNTDVLIKVTSPSLGEFLVLTEFQMRLDRRMPRRMRAYAGLAEEYYDCPVYPVLVNILSPGGHPSIPDRYDAEFLGLQVRQDYRVINLWDINADIVLQRPIPSLLPFMPILKGGGNESAIRKALKQLRAANQADMEPLLAFFATFVLSEAVVKTIMRWDMAVLQESPWYNEIVAEGSRREAIAIVLRQLTRRLATDATVWRDRLESLSLEQLETLAEDLLDFTAITDVEDWLARSPQPDA